MERIALEKEYLDQRSAGKREADRRKTGKRSVAVKIGGQEYRIRSDAEEAWLKKVAAAVDDAMQKIRRHTDTVDSLDVAVLTALNLARELLQLREDAEQAQNKVDPAGLRDLIELVEAELEADGAPGTRR